LKEGKNHRMVRTAGCGGMGIGKKIRKREAGGLKERAGKPRQKGRAGEDVIGRLNWMARGLGLLSRTWCR
jgi:hypothetical protein